ncbi:hypothetical protein H5410_021774 [Solanum commersonii]|uniref:Uncharacterized protein n=1 Tax=Solanum commersonii TaxID=4109 RepID=A0A9J5ZDH1_SOLCO|nr:hypothetical protein H5410_021774 [Solanum commersonii]
MIHCIVQHIDVIFNYIQKKLKLQINDVYISINYDEEFYWVFTIVISKQIFIRDKVTCSLLKPHHLFEVEYGQVIAQQGSDNMDCSVFVDVFC